MAQSKTTTQPEASVDTLEQAILERAEELARQQREKGSAERQRLIAEAAADAEKLETRLRRNAEEYAERLYDQRIQAGELTLAAERERLRWALVSDTLATLEERFAALVENEEDYAAVLRRFLREAAENIAGDKLVVALNDRDRGRFEGRLETLAGDLPANKSVGLAEGAIDTLGGLVVTSDDGRIRVDNRFEARLERMRGALLEIIDARLFGDPENGEPT